MRKVMYSKIVLCFLLVFLYSSAMDYAEANGSSDIVEIENMQIQLPEGVVYKQSGKPIDFITCDFLYKDDVILSAYIGNNPQDKMELFINNDAVELGINNHLFIRSITNQNEDGTTSRDVLVYLENRWPHYAHFYYRELPSNRSGIADKIIESVRKVKSYNFRKKYLFHEGPPPEEFFEGLK